jgi:hypothetical protein
MFPRKLCCQVSWTLYEALGTLSTLPLKVVDISAIGHEREDMRYWPTFLGYDLVISGNSLADYLKAAFKTVVPIEPQAPLLIVIHHALG